MYFSAQSMNITYERMFKEPVFGAWKSSVDILECFYKELNPRFPLAMSDLEGLAGTSMSSLLVRVRLFGGSGNIELSTEKLVGQFQNLKGKPDVDVVKEAITLSEKALKKALPETEHRATRIQLTAWLDCDGGVEAAQSLLMKRADSEFSSAAGRFHDTEITSGIRVHLRNEKEAWDMVCHLEKSFVEGLGPLFSIGEATYQERGKLSAFEERVAHFEETYLAVLDIYGLQPRAGSSSSSE